MVAMIMIPGILIRNLVKANLGPKDVISNKISGIFVVTKLL